MKPPRDKENAVEKPTASRKELIEGLDYYFENGLMVLTAHFLRERGYCCGNICRHCPYRIPEEGKSRNLISP